MLTVQDDWIQYEETPVRHVAVRGGAACSQRIPVVRAAVPARPVLVAVPRPSTAASRPAAAPRSRGAQRPLRLTRRGRLVLIALPALLVLSGAVVGTSAALGSAHPAPLRAQLVSDRTVVVAPGESLWSVAQRIAPQQDPRIVVEALQRANGLSGPVVAAGVPLHLPAAG